jgi:hypothetical protein
MQLIPSQNWINSNLSVEMSLQAVFALFCLPSAAAGDRRISFELD